MLNCLVPQLCSPSTCCLSAPGYFYFISMSSGSSSPGYMLQKPDFPASLRGTPTRMLSAGKVGETVMCMNLFQASGIYKTRQENMLTCAIGSQIWSVLLNIIEQEQNLLSRHYIQSLHNNVGLSNSAIDFSYSTPYFRSEVA